MDPDELFYARALHRIRRFIVFWIVVGGAASFLWRGWRGGIAFLLGSLASYLNFRWLKQLVDALGPAPTRRPTARFAILMGLRYLLLGLGGYVIVTFTQLNLLTALAGLFVSVAAVILEILFELTYARK
jgi:hypothetical protein